MTAKFRIDPALATLLGENYRSSEYAIKELIDNAWDADASAVWIFLPKPLSQDPIIIQDNGSGMTEKEVLNEYLRVASSRKSRKGEKTPLKNRRVKGRKGIGKFAGLLAANFMVLETTARGIITQLEISKESLINAQKTQNNLEKILLPHKTKKCNSSDQGTKITLLDLNQNLAFPNPEKLKQILVLEYGRKPDFKIYVNNEILDVEDIPGKTFDEEIELPDAGKVKLRFTIADTKGGLKQSGIAVRVQDKIIGKPDYFGLDEDKEIPTKLLNKIYGEIEADGLSEDVTADWGAIIENSKAYQAMSQWVSGNLKDKVEDVFKQEVSLQKARLQKEINEGLAKLPEYRRQFAQNALERIMRRFYGESEEKIGVIVSVILEAFERDHYWIVIQNIELSRHQDVETFAEALDDFGLVDIALMAQQARRRLQFLDELDDLIRKANTLESTMHKSLERNLWVFGPQYSLMASNKSLSRVISDYTDKKYSGARANKRPDLFLSQNIFQNYLLIEFKRPSHTLKRKDENQAEEYRDDLTPSFGKMDILVVGGKVDPNISAHYGRNDVKLVSYSSVISEARTQLQWLVDELTKQ